MTVNEFFRFASTLEGQRLETGARRAGFSFSVIPEGLEITPESSGNPRLVQRSRIELFLEEYDRTRSTRKRDYQEISFDASYLLAILARYKSS